MRQVSCDIAGKGGNILAVDMQPKEDHCQAAVFVIKIAMRAASCNKTNATKCLTSQNFPLYSGVVHK
jgi:hypothetical protein